MKSACGWLCLYFLSSIIVTSFANENKKYLVELGSEEKEDEVGHDYTEPNEDDGKVGIDYADINYADSDEDESNSKDGRKQIGRKQTFGDYVHHLNQHSIHTIAT